MLQRLYNEPRLSCLAANDLTYLTACQLILEWWTGCPRCLSTGRETHTSTYPYLYLCKSLPTFVHTAFSRLRSRLSCHRIVSGVGGIHPPLRVLRGTSSGHRKLETVTFLVTIIACDFLLKLNLPQVFLSNITVIPLCVCSGDRTAQACCKESISRDWESCVKDNKRPEDGQDNAITRGSIMASVCRRIIPCCLGRRHFYSRRVLREIKDVEELPDRTSPLYHSMLSYVVFLDHIKLNADGAAAKSPVRVICLL